MSMADRHRARSRARWQARAFAASARTRPNRQPVEVSDDTAREIERALADHQGVAPPAVSPKPHQRMRVAADDAERCPHCGAPVKAGKYVKAADEDSAALACSNCGAPVKYAGVRADDDEGAEPLDEGSGDADALFAGEGDALDDSDAEVLDDEHGATTMMESRNPDGSPRSLYDLPVGRRMLREEQKRRRKSARPVL